MSDPSAHPYPFPNQIVLIKEKEKENFSPYLVRISFNNKVIPFFIRSAQLIVECLQCVNFISFLSPPFRRFL